ncbi:MAG TPA: sulfurtransferase TusA family protein [Thermoflexus sp.]|nr:sulfurtransferase TusA family protein [Thermoflexus sp.]
MVVSEGDQEIDGELESALELDIRGEVCPYTYVKTRLALEEMAVGQVLRVLVDYEPATRNVPRSVTLQGDEVLKVEAIGEGVWAIWIRKRNPSI